MKVSTSVSLHCQGNFSGARNANCFTEYGENTFQKNILNAAF